MADLLFDRLGFGQTSKSVYSFNSTKQLNPNVKRTSCEWALRLEKEASTSTVPTQIH